MEIGANSTIDRGALEVTRIGRGAKIDNLVHIGHNCQIGEDVVIAAQTGLSGSIVIEKNVVLGGQVGIGEHARIEEGVMLGGQGGVLPNKVLRGKGVAFWGTPARPVREYLKQLAALARLARKDSRWPWSLVLGRWPLAKSRTQSTCVQGPTTNDQRPTTQFPMALIVIGGHSRSVGKTSVVAGSDRCLARIQLDRAQNHAIWARRLLEGRRALSLRD